MRKLIMIPNTIVMIGWPWKCFDALCFGAHRIVMLTSYSCSTGHGSKQSEHPKQTGSRKAARYQRLLLAATACSQPLLTAAIQSGAA
jgi:hypothetical protein